MFSHASAGIRNFAARYKMREKMLTNDSPDTVLFPNVVRPSPERLFSTDRQTARVHKVAEELPT